MVWKSKILCQQDKNILLLEDIDVESKNILGKDALTPVDEDVLTPEDKEALALEDEEVLAPEDEEVWAPEDKEALAPEDEGHRASIRKPDCSWKWRIK